MTKEDLRACAKELVGFHKRLAPFFGRAECQGHSFHYRHGLRLGPDRKSVEPMALPFADGSVVPMQRERAEKKRAGDHAAHDLPPSLRRPAPADPDSRSRAGDHGVPHRTQPNRQGVPHQNLVASPLPARATWTVRPTSARTCIASFRTSAPVRATSIVSAAPRRIPTFASERAPSG